MALDLRFQAPKVISPEMDKNRLLLLGLNLLNKGLNLTSCGNQPHAISTTVVKGEVKQCSKTFSSSSSHPPELAATTVVNMEKSRKRRRDCNADFSEAGKIEKR